ncbi:MAG: DUF4407 domain-containing protein [Chryseobacterium sp.]|nr:MAG: DUF4407 domain-containing protein [Chryseobacterium sp.]
MQALTKALSRIPYLVTGDSPEVLISYDIKSRKKIMQLGWLILLPVFIWFITTYLLVVQIMGGSRSNALISAVSTATIVFLLERSIVLAGKSNWLLTGLRLTMGIAIGIIGAFLLDLVIFENDIDYQMRMIRLDESKTHVNDANSALKQADSTLTAEMTGNGGSKRAGYGRISETMQNKAAEAKQFRDSVSRQLAIEETQMADAHAENKKIWKAKLGLTTIAYRMKIVDSLVVNNKGIRAFYWAFFILGFVLEFLPILTKVFTPKSAYELDQEAQERILKSRRDFVLERCALYEKAGLAGHKALNLSTHRPNHPLT